MEALLVIVVLLVLAVPVLLIASLVALSSLRQTVAELSTRVNTLEQARAAPAAAAQEPEPIRATEPPEAAVTQAGTVPEAIVDPAASAAAKPGLSSPPPSLQQAAKILPEPPAATHSAPQAPQAPQAPPSIPENPVERALARAWNWLLTGNIPVKVGMLVLLAGVAALLKYAGDQGWMQMPVELRLAGVSVAAVGALMFAWDRRERQRTFALALQGGAIGVLLLVVFAAVKLYAFIGTGFAFSISVLLIAGGAALAMVQHSRSLAVLSVLAGFMAPIWLADGSGRHVLLFSWYALLNAGIFAIAWARPWRSLNLLGFAFTWGIGLIWGVLQYSADKFATTQPFLALFFAFYLLLPILYARNKVSTGSARVDAGLLFATPLLAFSVQAGLLEGKPMPLALCALGGAALYALLGWRLMAHERLRRLAQGYAILAVGLATLAVPLALSANTTAAVFALEGAGLVWLGFAQQQRLARWSGLALQLAAALAWMLAEPLPAGQERVSAAIANAACMGGLLLALAGFAIAWLYRQVGRGEVALSAYVWALMWWLGSLGREIFEYSAAAGPSFDFNAFLLLFALTAWLAAEVQRRRAEPALAITATGCLMLAGGAAALLYLDARFTDCGRLFALISTQIQDLDCGAYPGSINASWSWLLFALAGVRSLYCLRTHAGRAAWLAQLTWWLMWTGVLALEIATFGHNATLADGWRKVLIHAPAMALLAVSLLRWRWLRWPLGAAFDHARPVLHIILLAVLTWWWLGALFHAGASAPLPWLVVFNPLDLAQIAVLLLAARWWQQQPWMQGNDASVGWAALALAGLVLISVMALRAVHHWGGESWAAYLLATSMAQTSLTVLWSVLGVSAWIAGSRRGHWGLWLGGALLMAVVLLKLLLVDRANLGNLLGIGAFIAYGLLCTLIGWLAPAPPRRKAAATSPVQEMPT